MIDENRPAAGPIPTQGGQSKPGPIPPTPGGQGKRKLPNLYKYVDPIPPDGYKLDYRFIERRSSRQNIALTQTLKDQITTMAGRYKLSQNSFINAVLNRFMDEVDRIDKANGDNQPPRSPGKKTE